jgi:two-component system, cell cycle response regulator
MRVLVVDDSSFPRKALRRELEGAGYAVEEAASGEAALRTISERPPDLVTLDVGLPGIGGFEVCMRMRAPDALPAVRRIPVVFMTADDTLEGRVKGFEVGAADFVIKGAGSASVLAAVNRILRPSQQLGGTTAIVADDSDLSRAILRDHLREEGVTVFEAKDGAEALALATDRADYIDLIVTDLKMPKLSGLELCARVRRDLGLTGLPIIVVSVVGDVKSVLDVFKAGATDYVLKPWVKEELLARVNSHLRVQLLNRRMHERVQELRELVRLKDRFTQVCSDNLRPPIQGVVTALESLAMRARLPDDDMRVLTDVTSTTRHVLGLINNLLRS